MNDDLTLLREYAATNSEAAFATLVSRHVNLVYSIALRQVRDAHSAEDITQAVFIILARKADKLGDHVVLSGWLCRAARYACAEVLRNQRRRQQREQEAHMQSTLNEPSQAVWEELKPLLNDAMEKLGGKDHDALVLRFFENKHFADVGAALGASEDAAKVRVGRALERLRRFFAKRGVHSTTAIIAGAISSNSVQAAPSALAQSVTAAAITKGATAGGSTLTLVKGALKIMVWTKMKTVVAATAAVLLMAAGTTTLAVKEFHDRQNDEWQLGKIDIKQLDKQPYRTVILPTKVAKRIHDTGGVAQMVDGRGYGIDQSIEDMLRYAFAEVPGVGPGEFSDRTVLKTELAANRYDYFSNLPKGAQEALQGELQRKFHVVARMEAVETNVLLLEVKYPGGPGLKPIDPRRNVKGPNGYQDGNITAVDDTMDQLADALESVLGVPVINRTGLKENYAFTISWDASGGRPNLDGLKQALTDQVGLQLIPTNMAIEMLVVEKAE